LPTTLLISDLHLGGRLGTDVLRSAKVREQLKERVADVDRLILLGDILEFRHSPQREALREGLPLLEDIGKALRKGTEVVLVPGNHDWSFLERWNAQRASEDDPTPLGLADVFTSDEASEAAAAVAQVMRRPIELRYPGIWVDDTIYATHGHYLDVHALLPTVERLGAGALQRISGELVPLAAKPADYERVLAPWYAFIGASVERLSSANSTRRATTGARAYERMKSKGPSARAFTIGLRASVAALNATGIGPLSAELSGQAVIASAMHGIDEVDARLSIGADHLIFGHCHRPGPLATDDDDAWVTRVGTRLYNTGNWVYEPRFQRSAGEDGAYWPGTGVVVEEGKAPRVERILQGITAEDLVMSRRSSRRAEPIEPPELAE
jgi:UDP-2,3-diacylglucosamine pyrophosphatase LpxH